MIKLSKMNTGSEIQNPLGLTFQNVSELLNRAGALILPLSVVGFTFCVLYAGYIRLFANGNSSAEQKSMKVASSAAIGFAVIFLANVLLIILTSVLKVTI